jgi:hypothetical protein
MIHAKHLVIYWYSKRHKAKANNDKLKDYFGATAPPYSTVTHWCRKIKLQYDILVIRRGPGQPPEVDLENAILDPLNEFPFSWLAFAISSPKETFVYNLRSSHHSGLCCEVFEMAALHADCGTQK